MNNQDSGIMFTPTVPLRGDIFKAIVSPFNTAVPLEYEGWKPETLSWTKTAYLGTSISMSFIYDVKGPEVQEFMKKYFVNNFDKFPVGRAKHGIMCNHLGNITADGVILRVAEDEYTTYWLWPYIEYCVAKGEFDVTGEIKTNDRFLFQIGGPNSLEILEKATGESLRDIEFLNFRNSIIAGHTVRILRLGMAGTLAYEVHGEIADAHDVYDAIWGAGAEEYGLKKLGYQGYMLNHTENGYPQSVYHFNYDYWNEPELLKWFSENPHVSFFVYPPFMHGSASDKQENLYRNPIECNWGGMINWKHDFVGKEVLQKLKENPVRKTVTLEWNADDIAEVIKSQFDGSEEPYEDFDRPNDYLNFEQSRGQNMLESYVKCGDKVVGLSSGRARCEREHTMISLGVIDVDYTEEGTELTVVWGDPGKRQKEIRVKVSRFPYLKAERNKDIDVKVL